MIFFELILSFMKIGLFSIGGGYAALPLIEREMIDARGWLNISEFADILTISQMTPGPIAINAATFVGMRVAGFGGAVCATLGCVLPSCVIVMLLAKIYVKYGAQSMLQGVLGGLRPAVVALIASAGVSIMALAFFKSGAPSLNAADLDFVAIVIFAAALFILRKWKLDPVLVMALSGAAGGIIYSLI